MKMNPQMSRPAIVNPDNDNNRPFMSFTLKPTTGFTMRDANTGNEITGPIEICVPLSSYDPIPTDLPALIGDTACDMIRAEFNLAVARQLIAHALKA